MLHTGRMLINLKARPRRRRADVWSGCASACSEVAGVTLYLQPTQDLTIDAETGPTQYRVSLEGADTATVTDWARRLVAQLQTAGARACATSTSDAGAQGLAAYVDDRPRHRGAARRSRASAVDDALYSAFGQRIVSTIFTETNQYRVILEAQPGLLTHAAVARPAQPAHRRRAQPTPLSAIATITRAARAAADHPRRAVPGGDDRLRHRARRRRSATRSTTIRARPRRTIQLPASVALTFLGASGAYENSLSNQLWLILAAVICVYIVLGVLYESYIHPLTILSTLPSAGVGALLALMLTGHDLGVIGIIGIILLIGIVKKNAIMMIDFAIDAERNEGKPPREAIHQAALLRFRPILMTTLAALFARAAADARLGRRRRAAPAARPRDLRRADRQPAADAVHDAGDLPRVRPARPALAPSIRMRGDADALSARAAASAAGCGAVEPGSGR